MNKRSDLRGSLQLLVRCGGYARDSQNLPNILRCWSFNFILSSSICQPCMRACSWPAMAASSPGPRASSRSAGGAEFKPAQLQHFENTASF